MTHSCPTARTALFRRQGARVVAAPACSSRDASIRTARKKLDMVSNWTVRGSTMLSSPFSGKVLSAPDLRATLSWSNQLGTHSARCGGSSQLPFRSDEHKSELQSLMRISYAVFCMTKNNIHTSSVTTRSTQH